MRKGIVIIVALLAVCMATRTACAAKKNLILKDDLNRTVSIPLPLKKIVSLAPNLTEIAFATGLGEKLAGITDQCNFPQSTKNIPRIGGVIDWSEEKVVSLNPDFVLALKSGDIKHKVKRLIDLGLNVFVFSIKNFDDLVRVVKIMGMLGNKDSADTLIKKIERILSHPHYKSRPKTAVFVSTDPLIPAGKDTFIDEIIRLAGGENAFDQKGYPRISFERLINVSPKYIVLACRAKKGFKNKILHLGLKTTIVKVDPDIYSRPGPRAIEAVKNLRSLIHGETK